jgi:hypothetical protein
MYLRTIVMKMTVSANNGSDWQQAVVIGGRYE